MRTEMHQKGRFYRLSTGRWERGSGRRDKCATGPGSNEVIEADEETLPNAEEDWENPEQIEVPKNMESDLPFTMQTKQSDRTRPEKKYNPYGDNFAVDRIDLKKAVEELLGLEEIPVSQDVDIVDDQDKE